MPTNVDDDACQIDSKAGTMLWRLLLIYQQYSQQSLLPAKHPVAKKKCTGTPPLTLFFETLKNRVSRKPCVWLVVCMYVCISVQIARYI